MQIIIHVNLILCKMIYVNTRKFTWEKQFLHEIFTLTVSRTCDVHISLNYVHVVPYRLGLQPYV